MFIASLRMPVSITYVYYITGTHINPKDSSIVLYMNV